MTGQRTKIAASTAPKTEPSTPPAFHPFAASANSQRSGGKGYIVKYPLPAAVPKVREGSGTLRGDYDDM